MPLFAALATAAERRVGEFNAQELANTAWAFVTASQWNVPLFVALARAAERRVGEFNAQNLTNTAWAFATASQWDVPLFAALARAAERRVREFLGAWGPEVDEVAATLRRPRADTTQGSKHAAVDVLHSGACVPRPPSAASLSASWAVQPELRRCGPEIKSTGGRVAR